MAMGVPAFDKAAGVLNVICRILQATSVAVLKSSALSWRLQLQRQIKRVISSLVDRKQSRQGKMVPFASPFEQPCKPVARC